MSGERSGVRRIAVVGLLLVVAVAAFLVMWKRWSVAPPPLPTLAEREEDRHLAALRAVPQFGEQLEGLPESDLRRAVREYAVRGMPRLPDDSLLARAVLVDAMLKHLDDETCGAVVQGKADRGIQEKAEASLGRSERAAWLDLIYAAARAELEGVAAPASNPAAVRDALRALVSRITPEDVPRLEAALGRLREIEPAEACWAGRVVYAQVPDLGAPNDRVVARLLAKP
jgi:hypothetical protein